MDSGGVRLSGTVTFLFTDIEGVDAAVAGRLGRDGGGVGGA